MNRPLTPTSFFGFIKGKLHQQWVNDLGHTIWRLVPSLPDDTAVA